MRKVKFFLFVITVCALFASCDKMTNNGNLDGMWQLISVSYNKTGGEDSIVNVKNERVYMNFQQKLGQITPGTFRTDSMGRYLLMRFEKKKVEC
ncbi:MAG: lipocalin-like domain-containing protein [Bacteroidaceae bacterium]